MKQILVLQNLQAGGQVYISLVIETVKNIQPLNKLIHALHNSSTNVNFLYKTISFVKLFSNSLRHLGSWQQ